MGLSSIADNILMRELGSSARISTKKNNLESQDKIRTSERPYNTLFRC